MKLRHAWAGANAADSSTGKADMDLREHMAATGQTHISQAQILIEAFDTLKEKGVIEEAYLRGSFGRGKGDEHSDVDLFVVVTPENLPKAYDVMNEYLKEKGSIVTSCHDRAVADYGGIGFEFLAHNKEHNKTFQFDFYMAIKGVPPVVDFYIKPRIFSKDPGYSWMKEYGKPRDLVLPEEARSFIRRHTAGEGMGERLELLLQEQMLNIFICNKHMKRGQTSRSAVVDNHGMIGTAVEMLQALTGYTSNGYTSAYLGNEVVKFCRENGDDEMTRMADRLEKLFEQKMSLTKMRDLLSYSKDVLQQSFPERFEKHKAAVVYFEKEVLGSKVVDFKKRTHYRP